MVLEKGRRYLVRVRWGYIVGNGYLNNRSVQNNNTQCGWEVIFIWLLSLFIIFGGDTRINSPSDGLSQLQAAHSITWRVTHMTICSMVELCRHDVCVVWIDFARGNRGIEGEMIQMC